MARLPREEPAGDKPVGCSGWRDDRRRDRVPRPVRPPDDVPVLVEDRGPHRPVEPPAPPDLTPDVRGRRSRGAGGEIRSPKPGGHASSGGRRRAVGLLGFAAAILGLLLLLAMAPALASSLNERPLSDVHAYYNAAARLNAGLPLYQPGAVVTASDFYLYPPLLAIVFRPLALFPFAMAAVVWGVLVLGALVATLLVAGVRRRATWNWVGILAFPIVWSAALGQAQLPVTLLLALATPLSVALAGQLKLLPAIAALWWLGRRDWRSLGRFAAWSAALAATQFVLEPRGTLEYLRMANLSLVGDIVNLSPYAISPILWAALAAAGAVLVIVTARRPAGWFVAVAYSTLVSPRLIAYLFVALLGGLGNPATSRTDSAVPDSASRDKREPESERGGTARTHTVLATPTRWGGSASVILSDSSPAEAVVRAHAREAHRSHPATDAGLRSTGAGPA